MSDLKKALMDITNSLEIALTTIAAHESALIERRLLTAQDIDRNMDTTKARHSLANVRHWIGSLHD
jgi:hypothetical protein